MRVLTVNAGSSSLKLRVVDSTGSVTASYAAVPMSFPAVDAVAHRVVHGGLEFHEPVLIDGVVEERLRALTDLAPLHQPKSLAALDAVRAALPDLPHVACFDTAFHATIPAAAATYALPREWRERHQVRRYGFHGLSHSWAARRAAQMIPGVRRIVTCHLGAGASLCAVLDGRSVDTTMGFTPLDGLVMATRPGALDPGLVLWLQEREPDLAEALEHRSGLLGLAGSADLTEILRRDDDAAQLALGVYLHRLRGGIASMAAALGGLDVCVFTGGVGENAPRIRQLTADGLAFLGLEVEPSRNDLARTDDDITAPGSRARTLVVTSREDLELARACRQLLT